MAKQRKPKGNVTVEADAGDCIDLSQLCDMHPRLPAEVATILVARASLALNRGGHETGVELKTRIQTEKEFYALLWPNVELDSEEQHDQNRITEDGAEAVALAVAYTSKSCRVVRRLQREEFADWLMEETNEKEKRKLLAYEVSGTERGSVSKRLKEKLAQVANAVDVDERWAGVVGFKKPEVVLQSVEE